MPSVSSGNTVIHWLGDARDDEIVPRPLTNGASGTTTLVTHPLELVSIDVHAQAQWMLEPTFFRRALQVGDDPLFNLQWHYSLVQLPAAWDISEHG